MSDKKMLRQPSSIAGLVKYDDGESKVNIQPMHVIGFAVGLVLLEVVLFLALPI